MEVQRDMGTGDSGASEHCSRKEEMKAEEDWIIKYDNVAEVSVLCIDAKKSP